MRDTSCLISTPLMHLFSMSLVSVNRTVIHNLLLLWDENSECFVFNKVKFNLTEEEVCAIMGLRFDGTFVRLGELQPMPKSKLYVKYFNGKKVITRPMLEKFISDTLQRQHDEGELLSLLIIYLFTTVFCSRMGMCHQTSSPLLTTPVERLFLGKDCFLALKGQLSEVCFDCQKDRGGFQRV